jgi:hypothetical protein
MNKRKGDEEGHHDKKHSEREREREHEHERERPRRKGREREVQLEFLKRRWHGSQPPTPEAYERALRQWRQLPGAIGTTATDLGGEGKSVPLTPSKKPLVIKGRQKRGEGHRHGA